MITVTLLWSGLINLFANNDSDIRGRAFRANGVAVTDDIPIATSQRDEIEASIDVTGNNNASVGVVSFTSDISGNDDLLFSFYNRQTRDFFNPINAVSTTNLSSNQSESSVAVADNGSFVIDWTNEFANNDDDVVYRRFAADGTAIDNLENPVADQLGNQNNSKIAVTPDGKTVTIVYEEEGEDKIKYRQFDDNAQPLTDALDFGKNSSSDEENPALAIGENINLVMVADDDNTNGRFNPYACVFGDQLTSPLTRFQNNNHPGTYLFAGDQEAQNIRQNFPQFIEEGIPSTTLNAKIKKISLSYVKQN